MGAMGDLAPVILGQSSTVGKKLLGIWKNSNLYINADSEST